jgi:hypothetical protein
MKNLKRISVLALFAFANSCSCDPYKLNRKLIISNNSAKKIAMFMSKSYPDSNNYIFESCQVMDVAHLVEPQSKRTYLHRVNWETEIKQSAGQGLFFFMYNSDSALKYYDNGHCATLYNRKDLVLKRFDVTIEYLNKKDWILSYP